MRREIPAILDSMDDSIDFEYSLTLEKILGRKAFQTRNNLFYDFAGRIVYVAGCNLIFS